LSGLLLMVVAVLFGAGLLTALTQTICWVIVFFFASAAASSAYLTASEIFPLETRALAIAVFYALGTLVGGAAAPWLFGQLIGAGSAWALSGGYALAGILMLLGAGMEIRLGIDAEGRSLEEIAEPLSG
jgi:MFS family permease